jgi:hypothetical protein
MLESALIVAGGIVIPLLTEAMENDGSDSGKQDCEFKAFKRLAERLAKLLGKGCVTLLADGLYACGPMVSKCREYGWEYMVTIKRGSMKTVWEEYDGLRKLAHEDVHYVNYGGRNQAYAWVNGIEYIYGDNHRRLSLNVVECVEEWEEKLKRSGGKPERKSTSYAWLSSFHVSNLNVFTICSLIARRRWCIENHFRVLKHNGYSYSHCFSYNWNAMKGFHALMKIGHFINTLVVSSSIVANYVKALGVSGFIKKAFAQLTYSSLGAGGFDIGHLTQAGDVQPRMNYHKLKLALPP